MRHTRWKPLAQARPPAQVVAWLAINGSLTKALRKASGAPVRARLVHNGPGKTQPDQRQMLGLGAGRQTWLREVWLHAGSAVEPCVYAQTRLPLSALRGRLRRITRLGSRPIGQQLFRGKGQVRRESLQVTRLPLGGAFAGLWARRSVLACGQRRILIMEVLLPALFQSATVTDARHAA